MSWVRLHDDAMSHPKIVGLSDKAFRLWIWGLSYCQRHLTDGLVASKAIPVRLFRSSADLLSKGLWETEEHEFRVHDYLDWNDDKETVRNRQRLAKHRQAFLSDPGLRRALRQRDGDVCRYCGIMVNWADRRGATGATYDHVNPRGDADLDNLVIACRGCNSRKHDRRPEEAGMVLRPEPRLNLDMNPGSTSRNFQGTKPNQTKPKEEEHVRAFVQFWTTYPKHSGRKDCEAFWARLAPSEALAVRILRGAEAYARHVAGWKSQFIKAPIRWLEGAHWDDELGGPDPKDYTWTCPHEPTCNARHGCHVKSELEAARKARTA